MGIADRLFACDDEGEATDKEAAADALTMLQALNVPLKHVGWDDYDGSIELHGVDPSWRMPADLQRRLYDEGFIKAYVNHTDYWETHYSFGTTNGFEAKRGWRVSYPSKRPNGGQILVEEIVPGWPSDWFKRPWWKWWLKPYVGVDRTHGQTG